MPSSQADVNATVCLRRPIEQEARSPGMDAWALNGDSADVAQRHPQRWTPQTSAWSKPRVVNINHPRTQKLVTA
jgi:hypothetical protein